MAPLKTKGDLAEMMVGADRMRRGYKQVKYSCSDGEVIRVKARDL